MALPPSWDELMQQAQQGNSTAYRHLLQQIYPLLLAICTKWVGVQQRDDLVQQILLTLHQIRHSYDPSRSFRPWLIGVARIKAREFFRTHGKIPATLDLDSVDLPSLAPNQIDGDAARLLAKLSSAEREAIRLQRVEGYSVDETAAKMQRSPSWVKVTIHRAVSKLQKQWQDDDAA